MTSLKLFGIKISDLEILLSSGKQFLLVFLVDVCHIGNIYVMLLGEMERTHNRMQLIFLKGKQKRQKKYLTSDVFMDVYQMLVLIIL